MTHFSKLLASILVPFIACSATLAKAAVANEQDGILLESEMRLAIGTQTAETRSKVILEVGQTESAWHEVARTKGKIALLGRRTGGDGDVVELEFKLIDRSASPEKAITSFKTKTRMGQRIDVSNRRSSEEAAGGAVAGASTDGESVDLSLTATRVRFQLD